MQVLKNKALAFFFSLFAPRLHHRMGCFGQNLCFSKNFSVGPLSFARSVAKLVKVGVNGKDQY
jgi:hypothetical protein